MNYQPVTVHVGQAVEVESFLAKRIHEFNAKATGTLSGNRST